MLLYNSITCYSVNSPLMFYFQKTLVPFYKKNILVWLGYFINMYVKWNLWVDAKSTPSYSLGLHFPKILNVPLLVLSWNTKVFIVMHRFYPIKTHLILRFMRSFEVTKIETPITEPPKPRVKNSLIDSPHPIYRPEE